MTGHTYNKRYKRSVLVDGHDRIKGLEPLEIFRIKFTLTAAAAGTPVVIIPDAQVGPNRKVYVTGLKAKVNGATNWTVLTSVKLEDTNAAPTAFMTILLAALTGNARIQESTANVTLEDAWIMASGGNAGNGLQIVADQNAGAGSDLVGYVMGYIQ